ncbi:PREDICTED: outer dense fiber protein 4 isoform X2 [Chinchilla lanigera]|uniref:outer dense fiber protein 4 isoform X2 n=1 Tax=Chinchilla lanigera TaxID=34839 RepID=UPI00038EC264|nr:PREDICTED: outer dense fiber protein 4 isoform X2 [Chinchilla lanigera]
MMESSRSDESIQEMNDSHWHPVSLRRSSVLPLRWRITHSPRWIVQVLVSELSLVAFVLLLVMVFSKKWLHAPGSHFRQHYPKNVSNRIHTSIHIMSLGLLHICRSNCPRPKDWKDSFKIWTNHPMFGIAKISFGLALELGLVLTIWLHLSYLPKLKKLHALRLVAIILSFCQATFIFFTLLLFAINLWTFELRKNISVPIGWGYFIGWLVFLLYVTCGVLCYFNYKNFWNPLHRVFGSMPCASLPAQ